MGRRQAEMLQRRGGRDGDGGEQAEGEVWRDAAGSRADIHLCRSPSCTIVCQVGHCLAFLTAKRGVLGVILLAAEGIFPGLNLMRGESQPAEPGLGLSEMASAGGQ